MDAQRSHLSCNSGQFTYNNNQHQAGKIPGIMEYLVIGTQDLAECSTRKKKTVGSRVMNYELTLFSIWYEGNSSKFLQERPTQGPPPGGLLAD